MLTAKFENDLNLELEPQLFLSLLKIGALFHVKESN
jgi:hypothetical protein